MRKTATNTTVRNVSKQAKLSKEHVFPKHIVRHQDTTKFLSSLLSLDASKETILFSLGKHLLAGNTNPLVTEFLAEYQYPLISFTGVPVEFDLLGAAYQYLNTKYENLTMGSFYTSFDLARDMTQDMDFSNGQTLIDPSCGSGVFLFAPDVPPEQLFGVDFDPIAVMLAKFNYFLKFPDTTVKPQIFEADFLQWYAKNADSRFTYVVGNPPYGANLDLSMVHSEFITTGESFSYFIEFGYYLLEENGVLSYLLPEALLNVKRHVDIRDFILDKTNLTKINRYDTKFAGVMSEIYQLELDKKSSDSLQFISRGVTSTIVKSSLKDLKNHIFTLFTEEDSAILSKVELKAKTSLKGSTFGLGVVTGDNTTKLLDEPNEFTEPIFTGKEVAHYRFTDARKHIVFDRKSLQQVAPDSVYRADVKLVYKVISKHFKVAIDTSKSLTSNSANIFIPKAEGNTAYSVALLFNSDLYSFLNQRLHGVVNKVSRENLEAMPLPVFNAAELAGIESLVADFIAGKVAEDALQDYVNSYFGLSSEQVQHIRSSLDA